MNKPTMRRWMLFLSLMLSLVLGVTASGRIIDMRPHWDDQTGLTNPHKGWYHHYYDNGLSKYLLGDDRDLLDFPGMDHLYLRLAWAYLEPQEGEYNWDVVDRIIDKWTARGFGIAFRISCRETGTQPLQQQFATPRWVIEAGAKGDHYYRRERVGPEGPWEPVYDDPVYLAKLENFIEAFSERYDGKPWLRYVDIGSLGDWGEGHTSSGSGLKYDYAQRKLHIDLHLKYFKKTQLVVSDDFVYGIPDLEERQRMHEYVVAHGITYRDDSILVDYYIGAYPDTYTVRSGEYFETVYRQRPTILELEHYRIVRQRGNWLGQPGSSMFEHGQGKKGADFLREALLRLHATYIGYHGYADVWLRENPDLTKELLNRCGYWYFLHQVGLPDRLTVGQPYNLQLVWENRGVAPAYHAHQLKVRLVGPDAQDFTLPAGNRRWMPSETNDPFTEDYQLQLPASMTPGTYTLGLRLHCPEEDRDVRLALSPELLDEDGYYRVCSTQVIAKPVALSSEVLRRFELSRGWKIKSIPPQASLTAATLKEAEQASDIDGWLAAGAMPATVHDILLRQRKIEAPWLPGGTEKCFWVGEQDWVYAVPFVVEEQGREAWLRFKGVEDRVDVYLNGERVASHSGKLPLAINVTGHLHPENSLVLHVHSNSRPGQADSPGRGRRSNSGSYLGPNPAISSLGVFDKVFVEISDGHLMKEIVTDVSLDEGLTKGTVTVDVAGTSRVSSVELRVGESTASTAVKGGQFLGHCVLSVDHPRLWWPRGYGGQPLYHAEIALLADGRVQQVERRTIGFRRVEMPELLHFVVNGVPVFLRGGAWVTPNLMSDAWDQAREERLFAMAENANFNAFRIWGPVEAPQDPFYEMADARGFLLWQDFTQLPMKPDVRSREICCEKAAGLIKRLKHHPSILCWCGCNESAQWAHEDYNSDFTDHGPWPGLPAAEAVGAVCKELDPDRYYQPSTPYFGMNPNDPREGNTHGYTNMWFVPGYDYLNFASEDTRIAAPPLHSLQRFMAPEDLWPAGYSTLCLHGNRYPFPKTWLPYTTSESWKKTGPVEQFYDATDAAGLVHRLGMAEALYYQDTIERQRRGRPAAEPGDRRCCGGYIVWKYNDSWPQVYSAKVDYFLEPYHAYYALRRAYAPVMLSFDIDTFLYLWAINDTREPVTGTVRIQLYHLERNEFRKEIVREVTVPPGKSVVVVQLDKAGIRAFRKEHILFATLTDASGRVLARANAPADIERRLTFPDAKLDIQVRNGDLVITTDKFARCVTLKGEGDPFGWFFEDNYFDLLPGETKVVRILGQHLEDRVTAKAWYSPHAATVAWRRP